MADASFSIAVICEDAPDQRTACGIADLVLSQEVDWLGPVRDSLRAWRGLRKSEPFLTWASARRLANEANIRTHGSFDGELGHQDALATRRALQLLKVNGEGPINAVLLIRDSDNQLDRHEGLNQARAQASGLGPIVIGLAHTKRECWVLAGFIATDDKERSRLDELRQELGFHPCLRADQLTASGDNDKRSAKRVLKILTDSDYIREETCWTAAPLDQLKERGEHSGLRDFIQEVSTHLVPLFTGRSTSGATAPTSASG
jgi:hypothetical protein